MRNKDKWEYPAHLGAASSANERAIVTHAVSFVLPPVCAVVVVVGLTRAIAFVLWCGVSLSQLCVCCLVQKKMVEMMTQLLRRPVKFAPFAGSERTRRRRTPSGALARVRSSRPDDATLRRTKKTCNRTGASKTRRLSFESGVPDSKNIRGRGPSDTRRAGAPEPTTKRPRLRSAWPPTGTLARRRNSPE